MCELGIWNLGRTFVAKREVKICISHAKNRRLPPARPPGKDRFVSSVKMAALQDAKRTRKLRLRTRSACVRLQPVPGWRSSRGR